MRVITSALFIVFALQTQAQLTKSAHQLMLFSGENITGERLQYESDHLKTAIFTLDNETYDGSTVAYFKNNNGYFASLSRIHGLNTERYAMRIQTGKINLFEEINMDVYGGDELKTEGEINGKDPMLASGKMYQYYSKGDQAVFKANYENLSTDLSDNVQSMNHLKKYRNYRILQWGLIGAGAGILVANLIAQTGGPVKFNPVMAIGIAIGGGSYFLETPKEDELWLAADEYNKVEEVLSER